MTLNVQLAADAESRLIDKARDAGVGVEEYATRLLEAEALRNQRPHPGSIRSFGND
jgi:hypothetical protein